MKNIFFSLLQETVYRLIYLQWEFAIFYFTLSEYRMATNYKQALLEKFGFLLEIICYLVEIWLSVKQRFCKFIFFLRTKRVCFFQQLWDLCSNVSFGRQGLRLSAPDTNHVLCRILCPSTQCDFSEFYRVRVLNATAKCYIVDILYTRSVIRTRGVFTHALHFGYHFFPS